MKDILHGGVMMHRVHAKILLACVVVAFSWHAHAGGPHPIARPYGGHLEPGEPSYHEPRQPEEIPIDHLVAAAVHILDQQCHNGGFGWPHDDCSATFQNITGPILLGVLGTHNFTRDAAHLVGPVNGGAFGLTYAYDNGEARFPTFTPIFMFYLARASDNTTFSTFVSTRLFDELVAGTYGPADLDTAGWIADIESGRTGAWVNLRPWEFHTLIRAARELGQPGQDALFEQGVLDGLDTLDNSDPSTVYSDIIGLAGAVRGLAIARRTIFDPISAPNHPGVDGIFTLNGLAAYLASLQNPDGSWYWHSNLIAPTADDQDVQTTAYATLALLEADTLTATSHVAAAQNARDWLVSMQLLNGGFPTAPGGEENTEVEGEALTAIAAFDSMLFVDGLEAGNTDLWSAVVP
jgi:hypothetical protein